ncbi:MULTISPECIES: hypothetical protein [Clostridium]|uniref:AAA+ ATPase domain-containing protein n=1 Tax=Clostridium cibarium TaxID=2762247 RepID=A0ABR8PVB7_9CLOT|nr:MULTISPECIES: hypothetical protein [Clostridium]MBD7912133.1 hypothetical protein [Clostridium cibarium]
MNKQSTRVEKKLLEEKEAMGGIDKVKRLIINEECVFKTKIENINEIQKSVFEDVYVMAAEILERIIDHEKHKEQDFLENYDYNNIIAFLGNQGSGKTTAMKSFRNSLNEDILKDINIDEYKKIKNNNFHIISVIDARCIIGEKSILEIIVCSMYKTFKEKKVENNLDEMIDLDNHFQEVYNDISLIKGIRRGEETELKIIMEVSSAISIKEHIANLIERYVKYMNRHTENNNFLVISIDNLEENLTAMKKVLEDIRKYFFIPRVIVLVTLNSNKEVENNIGLFLEDVIPFDRRVYMPSINLQNLKLKIDRKYFKNIFDMEGETAQQNLINILFRKLSYIIFTQKHYKVIIPNNLNKIIDLVIFLNSIKDEYTYEKKLKITTIYYEEKIIKYINEENHRKFLKTILKSEFNNLKRESLIYINELLYRKKNDLNIHKALWENILFIKQNKLLIEEGRINLGDIITWIKNYENLIESDKERKFIEIFKSIYTLRLLEMYYIYPEKLLNNTGFDFIGNYFSLQLNKKSKEISRMISVDESYSLEEFKDCFRYIDSYLLSVLLHPMIDSNIMYLRLVKSENKEFITTEDINKFNNYEFNYLNVIGYSLYKNQVANKLEEDSIIEEEFNNKIYSNQVNLDFQLLFVINLDSWLKILKILDKKYSDFTKTKMEFIVHSISIINNIFKSCNHKFKFCNYKNLIGEEVIREICKLYELFEKVCYAHNNY